MLLPRIAAVDRVCVEAPPGSIDELRVFYSEMLGLRFETDAAGGGHISANDFMYTLHFRTVDRPAIDPCRRRLSVLVASLDELMERLSENDRPFQLERGLSLSDRRLLVHDPAGHLVEVRACQML